MLPRPGRRGNAGGINATAPPRYKQHGSVALPKPCRPSALPSSHSRLTCSRLRHRAQEVQGRREPEGCALLPCVPASPLLLPLSKVPAPAPACPGSARPGPTSLLRAAAQGPVVPSCSWRLGRPLVLSSSWPPGETFSPCRAPHRSRHPGMARPPSPPLQGYPRFFTPQGPSSRTQRPLRGSAVKGLCAPPSSFPPTSTPTLTSSEGRPAPRPAQHQQLLGATSPRPSALRARVLTCPGPAAAPSALPRSCSSPHISALALGPERPGTGAMPSRPSAASRSPPGVCPGLGACSAGREGPGDGDA